MSNAEVLKQYIDSGCTLKLEALPYNEVDPQWVDIYAINGMQARLASLHYLVKSDVKLRVAKEKRLFRVAKVSNEDYDNPADWLVTVEKKDYITFENYPRFIQWVTEEMEANS